MISNKITAPINAVRIALNIRKNEKPIAPKSQPPSTAPQNPDDDIAKQTKAEAAHDQARQPPGHRPDNNPDQ